MKIRAKKSLIFFLKCQTWGKDTIGYSPNDYKYLLIVNVDSTGCTPCSVSRLSQWKEWIELSEKKENHFMLVFVFHPRKNEIKDVVGSMKYYSQVYKETPLYLDKNGSVLRRNFNVSIPEDMQTVLVDKTDSVVFVGNPVYNNNVKKELTKIINY